MDDQRRQDFLAVYESCRVEGDVAALEEFLSDGLVLEDPQLDRGRGSRDTFLALTKELAAQTEGLAIRRHGPVCVSADGTWFTQRWLGRGRAPAHQGGTVAFETVEVYQAPGSRLERIAVLVRDLKQTRPAVEPREPAENGSTETQKGSA